MEYLGVKFDLKNTPKLDAGFIPFGVWMDAYLEGAKMPISIAVERQEAKFPSAAPLSTAQTKWPLLTIAM